MNLIKNMLIAPFTALLFVMLAAQPPAAVKLPATQAGQRVAAYITAFNSGSDQAMREFFEGNIEPRALLERPAEARLNIFRSMRERLGKLEVRKVIEASDSSVTLLVETSNDGWSEIRFEFEPQAPFKMLFLRIQDAEGPGSAPSPAVPTARMTEPEMLESVSKYLSETVAKDEFSGTVLIAKNSKSIFHKAYGLASREFNVPNKLDTKFNLGSINKTFTELAIGQLVDQGKLSLDAKLGELLPDYPNRQAAEKVSVRHLLNMTSGIGDFFGPEFQATPKDRIRGIRDYLQLFAAKPLEFEPGTRNRYSNGGYVVLGAIIEKVSGEDYYGYVREHIFKPAGMMNTDSYESDVTVPNLASGYTKFQGGDQRRNNIYTRPARGSSAGGGYSTAEDLLKFVIALRDGRLREKQPGRGEGMGIAGGAPGLNGAIEMHDYYTVIVLSNYDPPAAERVARQILGWVKSIKD